MQCIKYECLFRVEKSLHKFEGFNTIQMLFETILSSFSSDNEKIFPNEIECILFILNISFSVNKTECYRKICEKY